MKVKTGKLTGAALDYAVAVCEGHTDWCPVTEKFKAPRAEYGLVQLYDLNYSTDWAQGGPIFDRCRMGVTYYRGGVVTVSLANDKGMVVGLDEGDGGENRASVLVAAMRCYVASKLGDEVEIPEGLQ